MKKIVVVVFIVLTGFLAKAQDSAVFQSDVDTFNKPWTHLVFYNDPENFQFAIVSDLWGGYREGIFEEAVQKLNLLYPEFVLSVGDLISGKLLDTVEISKEWTEFNQKVDSLNMPFFYLPGNHDISNRVMAEEWEKRFGRRYYNFVYKNVLFLILDSNDDEDLMLTEKQVDYAREVIKSHTEVRWTFVLMHHPLWDYKTDGRFGQIEQALSGRPHTVIAGHRHHYHYSKKGGNNYYVLSTTGAGNKLRGNYFGEFDHFTWITMADGGPVMSNLRLDGILPHDIATAETYKLAGALQKNTEFEHKWLIDNDSLFSNGTLSFHFKNNGNKPLKIHMQFFHHHQVNISNSLVDLSLDPGDDEVIEIQLSTQQPLRYQDIGALQIAWQMQYDAPEYPDFTLKGNLNLPLAPTETDENR